MNTFLEYCWILCIVVIVKLHIHDPLAKTHVPLSIKKWQSSSKVFQSGEYFYKSYDKCMILCALCGNDCKYHGIIAYATPLTWQNIKLKTWQQVLANGGWCVCGFGLQAREPFVVLWVLECGTSNNWPWWSTWFTA